MKVELGNYQIVLHAEVISVMEFYTQHKRNQPESGGIVLGKIIGDEIHVLRLSPPTELDKADRTNFERHRLSAQIIINHEFHNSNRQVIYLGEWHTHPEDFPTPSGVDMSMIKKQFRENKIHIEFLLLLIKGIKALYIATYSEKDLKSTSITLR